MYSRTLTAIGIGLLAVASSSCGDDGEGGACAAYANPTLAVRITQGPGGPRVCDAVVTARDGNFSQTLTGPGLMQDCAWYLLGERPGTYEVKVVAGAQTKTVTDIQVAPASCHISTANVTVELDP
jgi:hypothetical protein